MTTLKQFIRENALYMSCKPARTPNRFMPNAMHHWDVTITRHEKKMSVAFSQGPASHEPPSFADVLDCLAQDSAGVDGESFNDWCEAYGYDGNVPGMPTRADRYRATKRQAEKLKNLLGAKLYEQLLWEIEEEGQA